MDWLIKAYWRLELTLDCTVWNKHETTVAVPFSPENYQFCTAYTYIGKIWNRGDLKIESMLGKFPHTGYLITLALPHFPKL